MRPEGRGQFDQHMGRGCYGGPPGATGLLKKVVPLVASGFTPGSLRVPVGGGEEATDFRTLLRPQPSFSKVRLGGGPPGKAAGVKERQRDL